MKKSAAPSFFDVYAMAWQDCRKVWPLFLVHFLFLVLQYAALFLCLALLFGPFLARNIGGLLQGLKDPKTHDWSAVTGDWLNMVSDPTWWVILLVVIFLYTTWWCLLGALEDGGVYGTFWDQAREGRPFSFGRFFEWGFKMMLPMLWLQFYLGLLYLLVLVFWAILGLMVVGFLALLGFPLGLSIGLGILIGAPCLLFWVLFTLGFGVFIYLTKAFLTLGLSAREAVRTAFSKFKADSWRVGTGLAVALVLYIAATMAIRFVLMVLGMIPLLGILFQILDMFVAMALALFIVVYLSGLSVTYLKDEEAA